MPLQMEPVRILHLDDSPLDAQLVKLTLDLARDQLPTALTYVRTRKEFLDALQQHEGHARFDLILSDYRMPGYDGDQALADAKRICPDIPFIMVTGEMGEDRAIETLHRGASDYVLKGNMIRLVPAIERALADGENTRRRIEAEAALKREHENSQKILESIGDAFYSLDREWHFTYVNQHALALWSKSSEELLGKHLWEAFPGVQGSEAHRRLQEAMDRHTAVHFETHSQLLDTWVEVHVYPSADGGISVYFRDIAERRQMEGALRQSEERFATAFRASPYPLVISRASDGTILEVNDAFLGFFGYPGSDILGRTSLELGMYAEPLDRPRILEEMRQRGRIRAFETRVRLHSGEERMVLLSAETLRLQDEPALLTIIHDVTEERRALEALRKSEERLRLIQEASLDGFTIHKPRYDEQGEIVDFIFQYENAAAARSNGTDPEQVVGRGLLELFPGVRETRFFAAFRQAAASGTPAELEEHYQGESVRDDTWFRVVVVPAGEVIAVLTQDVTARRLAEQELRQAHRETVEILDSVQDPFYVVDSQWRLTYVNAHAVTALRRSRSELLGRNLWELFPQAIGTTSDQMLHRAMQERISVQFETHSNVTGGWIDVHAFPKADGGLSVSYRDISERKQAEEELRLRESDLARAQKAAHLGSWRWNLERDRVTWSEELFRVFGVDPGTFIPSNAAARELIHPDDRDRHAAYVALALEGQPVPPFELRIIRPSGEERVVLASGFEVEFDPAGKPAVLHGTLLDITERKQGERERERLLAEVRQHTAQYDALFSSMVVGIAVYDTQGKLLSMNPTARAILGYTEPELGLHYSQRVVKVRMETPDGRPIAPEETPLSRALRGETVQDFLFRFYRGLADTPWLVANASPIRTAEGTMLGAVSVFLDVTEQKRAEEALRSLSEELEGRVRERTRALEAANKELEAFSYSVSHDLKAPLRVISGYAGLLAQQGRGNLAPKQHEMVGVIQQSARHMDELIRGLLEFSRLSRKELQLSLVDTDRLVEEVLQEQRRALGEEAGGRVKVEIAELPQVKADPLLLRQVFANLLSNAFKFTRTTREPWVRIEAEHQDSQITFRIADNGVGFPSHQAEKLFQVFQRLHAQAEFEGTGIGLTNVRKIIERLGGQVCADGEEGKGASFYFTLPDRP